jgi:hypothetical protein
MSAPTMPNPTANPITDRSGNLRPEWVRYIALLVAYIDALEARIAELEAP